MFCRNCGKEVAQQAVFCPGCGSKPLSGSNYCQNCGVQVNSQAEVCVKCGVRLAKTETTEVSPKSRLITTLLAWFLGVFGAHRFYAGKTVTAVVMLILGLIGFSTVWFFGVGLVFIIPVSIWALVDFIFSIVGRFKDNKGLIIEKW
jgi:TM2 domain-containing membrane protein YozV